MTDTTLADAIAEARDKALEEAVYAAAMARWGGWPLPDDVSDDYRRGLDTGHRQQGAAVENALRNMKGTRASASEGRHEMTEAPIDRIARAICREQCAFYGEPPCHETGDWPNEGCNEPGCIALARAAAETMGEAK